MAIVRDFFTLILGAAGLDVFREAVRGEVKDATHIFAERIKHIAQHNPRAQFVKAFLELNDAERRAFVRHYAEVRGTARENSFIVAVAELLERNADGSLNLEASEKIYKNLFHLDPQTFQDVVEMLKHDPFMQGVRAAFRQGKGLVEGLIAGVAYTAGAIDRRLVEPGGPNERLRGVRDRVREERNQRGLKWLLGW